MPHLRQQIREAVKTALTGLAATGTRVYTGRTRALGANHEPTLLIYTSEESSSRDANGNPPMLRRVLTLHVEGRVVTADVPDDDLDEIDAQVEAAIWPNVKLGGLALNMVRRNTLVAIESDGESHVGGIRMTYEIIYRNDEGDPTVAV